MKALLADLKNNDVRFIEPVRWMRCEVYPTGATQTHFHAHDMHVAYSMAELVEAWTQHGISAANDPRYYKGKAGLIVPGVLKSGGSTTPLPKRPPAAQAEARREYDKQQYRYGRHPDTITGSNLAVLDIDGMSAELFARLIGTDGKPAALAEFCALAYTTASHTPEAPRARVIGILADFQYPEDKPAACLRFASALMDAAGAERVAPGRWEYQGAAIGLDKSVYLVNQGVYAPDCDASSIFVFTGRQLTNEDLPEISAADLATASGTAGAKTATNYSTTDNFTGDALELAEWFESIGGEPGAKPGLFTLADHPFKSDPLEDRQHDTSFALQVDETAEKSRFQSKRNSWIDHLAECKAAGKSANYAAAIMLKCPEDLARRVWGGETLFKAVADAEDFDDLSAYDEDAARIGANFDDYCPEADPFAHLADVDIFNPPGLLGEIYRDVERLAHRSLPMASIAAAVQLAAIVGGLSGKRSVNGGKLSPLTITLALSASGKEAAQNYVKDALDCLTLNNESCVRFVQAKPRSDKEVMRSVLRNAVDVWEDDPQQAEQAQPRRYGSTLIIGDEADQLFSAMGNRNAATSTAGIGSILLEVTTSKRFSYSSLHREEELHTITTKREALENKLEEAEAALAIWESGEKPKRKIMPKQKAERVVKNASRALARLALRETLVIKGVRNPVFAAMLSAVPATFSRFISDNAADSGLLSRALILMAGEEVGRLRVNVPEFDPKAPKTAAILHKLAGLIQSADFENLDCTPTGYTLTPEAAAYRAELADIFETEDYREHPTLGAIYRRAALRLDELATLTALDTGVIDVSAYQWATKIFNVSTAAMRSMIDANNAKDVGGALKIAIVNYLQDPRRSGHAPKSKIVEGIMRAKTMRQARQAAKLAGQADPFDVAFDSLLKSGVVKAEARNGGEQVTLLKKL